METWIATVAFFGAFFAVGKYLQAKEKIVRLKRKAEEQEQLASIAEAALARQHLVPAEGPLLGTVYGGPVREGEASATRPSTRRKCSVRRVNLIPQKVLAGTCR